MVIIAKPPIAVRLACAYFGIYNIKAYTATIQKSFFMIIARLLLIRARFLWEEVQGNYRCVKHTMLA